MKLILAAAAAAALAIAPAAAFAGQPPAGFTGPQKPGGFGNKGPNGQNPGAKPSGGYKQAGGPGYGNTPGNSPKKHPSHPGYKSPSGKR